MVWLPFDAGLGEQIRLVQDRYAAATAELGLGPETAIFRKLFVSDALNQAPAIRASALYREASDAPVATAMVQQPPLPGSKIALLAYHVESDAPIRKRRLTPNHVVVEKNGFRHLWTTGLCGAHDAMASPVEQTSAAFDGLIDALAGMKGTLRDNCVRTWIYVKDIDLFYQGMVEGRRELFARHGLSAETHFIASTGIGGACAHRYDLVAMDAYSILGLTPEQVLYLNDFDRLCATARYNVTFERGTRIAYADRSHFMISGTASIDRDGRVLHTGDVLRQLDRAVGNVEALLRSGGATLEDLMYAVVYLRDATDFERVSPYLSERLGHTPFVVVRGTVCRPEWLVELEGLAVAGADRPELPSF